jgi:hypothetical protein
VLPKWFARSASRTATSPPRPHLSGPRRGHCKVGDGLFLRRLVSLSRDRLAPPFTPARLALELSIGRSDAWRHVEDFRSCRRNSRHIRCQVARSTERRTTLKGTCALISIGRLAILSEAVTTQASPAGRLAGSKYAAQTPIAQSAVAQAKAAQALDVNASP